MGGHCSECRWRIEKIGGQAFEADKCKDLKGGKDGTSAVRLKQDIKFSNYLPDRRALFESMSAKGGKTADGTMLHCLKANFKEQPHESFFGDKGRVTHQCS